MCLIVSLLTDCSQRALSGIRHGETPFLILTVADDAVSGSISRRSARHEQNSSVLPGDHSHRRRQPLRRCMARRGRLYSDKPRVGYPGLATIADSSLANPWGSSHGPTTPFWISNQVTNTSTLYAVTGSLNTTGSLSVTKNPLTVTIPMTASGPQGPTGQVAISMPTGQLTPHLAAIASSLPI